MGGKAGNFFEKHIEKIVLAIVGIVCVWLLITRVVISPNTVSYDNNKFSPGSIDIYIKKQTELLVDKFDEKPESERVYETRAGDFAALVESAIDVDTSVSIMNPSYSSTGAVVKPKYSLPAIGEVNEVSVGHIRAVAYVPTGKIDADNIYDAANSEPNDVDFVTVEAKFDVAELCKRFYESFAGGDIPEEWRDPCLANPVFAAVQLQRQQLRADGSWSDWQVVPRTKIDPRGLMFKVIEDVEKLPPGGMEVRLIQFNNTQVRMDLLQPEAYRIASAGQEWFPPSLHKEYLKILSDIEAQEKRQAMEAEREERERARSEQRRRTPETRTRTEGVTTDRYTATDDGGISARMRRDRHPERERPERGRETSETKAISEVYNKFEEVLITEESDFARMGQPLVFWTHDDTVEPGKSYRYRIRLGVFNPVAGTDRLSEQSKQLRNKAILWSKFSEAADIVKIPETLYFFPRDIQEATKTVSMTVCRYVLGYWYSKDFMVKQGEVIGEVSEYEITEAEEKAAVKVPKMVDYSTGAVLVDVVTVHGWTIGNNPTPRYYRDMLYTFDGTDIEHTPIKQRYWAEGLRVRFNEIRRAQREPKQPLQAWSDRRGRLGRRAPGLRPEELDEVYMEQF